MVSDRRRTTTMVDKPFTQEDLDRMYDEAMEVQSGSASLPFTPGDTSSPASNASEK
jgi:hypothetical protein